MPDSEFNKMKVAIALKALRETGISREKYERIAAELVPQNHVEAVGNAISGLSEEDEFALNCRLMGTATHLVKLDQTPLIPGKEIVPDFFGQFRAGCRVAGIKKDRAHLLRCLIEVKSTEKKVFEIKSSALKRRLKFAQLLQLPLFIAVRFLVFKPHPSWVIVRYTGSTGKFRVRLEDMDSDLSFTLWDDYLFMLFPCRIFARWEKETPTYPSLTSKWGHLCGLRLVVADRSYEFRENSAITFLLLDNFHLQTHAVTEDGETNVEELTPARELVYLREIPFHLHKNAKRENGPPDAAQLLDELLSKDKSVVDRQFIEKVAEPLLQMGVLGRIGYGDEASSIRKWKSCFEMHFSEESEPDDDN